MSKANKQAKITVADVARAAHGFSDHVMVTVSVSINGIKQTKTSKRATNTLQDTYDVEDGAIRGILKTLPEPISIAKKWVENHRAPLYRKGGYYKHAGDLCALVEPSKQEEFLQEAREFVATARKQLYNAIIAGNTADPQAGWEMVVDDYGKMTGKLSDEQALPLYYGDMCDAISVRLHVRPFSHTIDYKNIQKSVVKAIKQTQNNDAITAYNGMLDTMENALMQAVTKIKEHNDRKQPVIARNGKPKWPDLSKSLLDSVLFTKMENIEPMFPKINGTNPVFSVVYGVLGTDKNKMRELIESQGIDFEKVLKRNPRLGKTTTGLRGLFADLFDDDAINKLAVNKAHAKYLNAMATDDDDMLPVDDHKMKRIGNTELVPKLIKYYKALKAFPRLENLDD